MVPERHVPSGRNAGQIKGLKRYASSNSISNACNRATGIASRWDETFWRYDALIYAKLLIPILLKIKII